MEFIKKYLKTIVTVILSVAATIALQTQTTVDDRYVADATSFAGRFYPDLVDANGNILIKTVNPSTTVVE
jgi:hypothetical protein